MTSVKYGLHVTANPFIHNRGYVIIITFCYTYGYATSHQLQPMGNCIQASHNMHHIAEVSPYCETGLAKPDDFENIQTTNLVNLFVVFIF